MAFKLDGWTKFIILAISTLIAIGIYIATVKANTERSKANALAIQTNIGDIREIKTDLKYIKKGVDELRNIKHKE